MEKTKTNSTSSKEGKTQTKKVASTKAPKKPAATKSPKKKAVEKKSTKKK